MNSDLLRRLSVVSRRNSAHSRSQPLQFETVSRSPDRHSRVLRFPWQPNRAPTAVYKIEITLLLPPRGQENTTLTWFNMAPLRECFASPVTFLALPSQRGPLFPDSSQVEARNSSDKQGVHCTSGRAAKRLARHLFLFPVRYRTSPSCARGEHH